MTATVFLTAGAAVIFCGGKAARDGVAVSSFSARERRARFTVGIRRQEVTHGTIP
jgi:hypothetical protein